jgi:catechol 2,3-dioxygenase-like lactoylglutathione lyase family enzyme
LFERLLSEIVLESPPTIKGISHITLIVRDLDRATQFFEDALGAQEVYSSGNATFSLSREKFLLVSHLWLALMEGESIQRSYNHIAFEIAEEDLPVYEERLHRAGAEIRQPRSRKAEEGQSIYFYDLDGHLFELHAGTLERRLSLYRSADCAGRATNDTSPEPFLGCERYTE